MASISNRRCRICLEDENQLFNIFDQKLNIKIMNCARIHISQDDELPQLICTSCKIKLDTSYDFRLLCETSDDTLRNALNKKYALNFTFNIHDNFINDFKNVEEEMLVNEENNFKTDLLSTINDAKKIGNNKPLQCDLCGKVFNKGSHLKAHSKTHTGEKPFKCTVCGKGFRLRHHLLCHSRIHTSERPYQCLHCGKCFTENSSLSRHTKIHTNEKKFPCNRCSKRFITLNDARKHMVRHSGEKRFHCLHCPKQYSDSSSLSKHSKQHKPDKISNCPESKPEEIILNHDKSKSDKG